MRLCKNMLASWYETTTKVDDGLQILLAFELCHQHRLLASISTEESYEVFCFTLAGEPSLISVGKTLDFMLAHMISVG